LAAGLRDPSTFAHRVHGSIHFQYPVQIRKIILAARCARAMQEFFASLKSEGAGKTGCALHPLAENAHEHTGSAEAIRLIPSISYSHRP
jgi:hypothetical protein